MKKFCSLSMGCLLMLAGSALAQQPEGQPTAPPEHANQPHQKTHAAKVKPEPNAVTPGTTTGTHHQGRHEAANPNAQGAEATPRFQGRRGGKANVTGQPETNGTPNVNQEGQYRRHGRNVHGANAQTSPSTTTATSAAPNATPAAAASASTAAVAAPNNQPNRQLAGAGGGKKKPDPQQVQQIKSQHTNFRAQPKPQQVPAVTFNQSYRIEGSDRWQGQQYAVFRSYHPERHDEHWYHSHYQRVVLIGGGYYYWNSGYWFPAWGYSPAAEYYAYDGPIYVGHRAEPPDQVIADVQDVLKQMGYYEGEVDGLLGPLTRQALAAYQADEGLTQTAAIDEPTLDSLQLG